MVEMNFEAVVLRCDVQLSSLLFDNLLIYFEPDDFSKRLKSPCINYMQYL